MTTTIVEVRSHKEKMRSIDLTSSFWDHLCLNHRVRALAILGPNASPADLHAFNSPAAAVEPLPPGGALDNADVVLVLGGDGTVHRHLAALSQLKIPVLMVPRGSGNDFARSLGIATRAQAFVAWNRFCSGAGSIRDVDLGLIRRPGGDPVLFCCVAGAGLDSDANRRANAMPRWLRAHGGYLLAALWSVLRSHPQRFLIEVDENQSRIEEPGLMVALANAPAYGDAIPIAPRARLDDGLLDVCFVRGVGRLRLLRLLPTVFSGRHIQLREVEYFQSSRLRIAPDPPRAIYADGEYIGETPAEIEVVPRALRVIVTGESGGSSSFAISDSSE